MRKENKEKLDKIFNYFEEKIFNENEKAEYASRTTRLMVAFGDWIENRFDLAEVVYNVFGSANDRLVDKVYEIFNRQVFIYLTNASKPWWVK